MKRSREQLIDSILHSLRQMPEERLQEVLVMLQQYQAEEEKSAAHKPEAVDEIRRVQQQSDPFRKNSNDQSSHT